MAHASGFPLQGRLTFQGLKVSIENRKGSYREDKNHIPPKWRTKMCCHYGYIRGSEGVDGDHVDVFIGPNPDAEFAYIVRQVRPDTGAFDEQKVMLGFNTAREAKEMYLRHYDTPLFFGGLTAMPMEDFCRKVMDTLHGSKLIKSLRCVDMKLEKARVEGHFRTTHGGKQVWVESYDDSRVLHARPKNEQAPRRGDSLLLFPEIGHVRPIPEPAKPKPVAPQGNQLSMFGEFKSIAAHDVDSQGLTDDELAAMAPAPLDSSAPAPLPSNDTTGNTSGLVYARPGLQESIAAAAMLCALKEACSPRDVVAIAAQRRHQAATVATMFYDGLVSDANLAAIQSATGVSPAMFRVVLARLRDELHNQNAQDSDSLVPLTPLESPAPTVSEIPL